MTEVASKCSRGHGGFGSTGRPDPRVTFESVADTASVAMARPRPPTVTGWGIRRSDVRDGRLGFGVIEAEADTLPSRTGPEPRSSDDRAEDVPKRQPGRTQLLAAHARLSPASGLNLPRRHQDTLRLAGSRRTALFYIIILLRESFYFSLFFRTARKKTVQVRSRRKGEGVGSWDPRILASGHLFQGARLRSWWCT